MRRTSAVLAVFVTCFGFFQVLIGRGEFFAFSVLIYSAALVGSAMVALRGGPIIYLATSWGLYLGLNLAAYADVVYASSQKSDPLSIFISVVLSRLPLLALIGLGLTLLAYRKEKHI